MSSSVTFCKECRACNWAGKEKCEACGGELEPTLAQVHTYCYATDLEFKKFVDEEQARINK